MRTPDNWRKVADDKTGRQLAEFVLSDLVGYRSASSSRKDDADSLTNLILYLRDQG